ncbi:MAG: acylphosphatase [Sphingomonas sp.]
MSKRIRVSGRVQGVWYRAWTVDEARSLGLDGWVRNRRDGSVEMLLDGPDHAVTEMIQRTHRGPSAACVERVDVEETDEAAPAGFAQRETA